MLSWLTGNKAEYEIAEIIHQIIYATRCAYNSIGVEGAYGIILRHPFLTERKDTTDFDGLKSHVRFGGQLSDFGFTLYQNQNMPALQAQGGLKHAGWHLHAALDKKYLASYCDRALTVAQPKRAKSLHGIFISKYGALDGNQFL